MRYIDGFHHGTLAAGVATTTTKNDGSQTVFFVASGSGKLQYGDERRSISEGDAVLIPPGVEHVISNDGETELEMLIVTETSNEDKPYGAPDVLSRNYRESDLVTSHWHYLVHIIFGASDGLMALRDVLVVRIDPMTTGDSHGHGPNMDEVWYMWRGECVHVVSKEVCLQTSGTAVSVCPSDPGHSLINHTEKPAYLFYFCSQDLNT